MSLQTDLEQIVKLAGTDPRYASLAEALTVKCLGSKAFYVEAARRGISKAFIDICQGDKCPWCHGSGRVLRSWDTCPPGALKGTLLVACEKANLWPDADDWFALSNKDLVAKILKEMKKCKKNRTSRTIRKLSDYPREEFYHAESR